MRSHAGPHGPPHVSMSASSKISNIEPVLCFDFAASYSPPCACGTTRVVAKMSRVLSCSCGVPNACSRSTFSISYLTVTQFYVSWRHTPSNLQGSEDHILSHSRSNLYMLPSGLLSTDCIAGDARVTP